LFVRFEKLQMSNSEDSSTSKSAYQERDVLDWVSATALVTKLKYLLENQSIPVNPPCPIPKLTGKQWMQQILHNPTASHENLCMSRDAFL
jgi:hypothetical protein